MTANQFQVAVMERLDRMDDRFSRIERKLYMVIGGIVIIGFLIHQGNINIGGNSGSVSSSSRRPNVAAQPSPQVAFQASFEAAQSLRGTSR